MYYNTPQTNRYRRVGECHISDLSPVHTLMGDFTDWLRDKIYFEGLSKKDHYTASRLGFKAPNIFVMNLAS